MRTAFINTLLDLAAHDQRITLVVGDLGFGVVEPFAGRFPDRFINAGVAEQNMMGIAAGLALSGRIVFIYSIGNFPTLRCLEQIRNDVCYHAANVKIVSVGGGFAYGALGASHHATEDIAIMRALPQMTVIAPGDPLEAQMATAALTTHPGPAYLRLGRAGEPLVHSKNINFKIGKAVQLLDGSDITLISTGAMLHDVFSAAATLERHDIHARVLSMHTIKPLDAGAILAAARETAAILIVEEHSIIGGLGSAVAEVLAEYAGCRVLFRRLGLPSQFTSLVGTQTFLRQAHFLSAKDIADSALQLCRAADSRHSAAYAD
ncbi:MAG TPA: transketolase C-terminal domain-containing protein [Candidatus Acidoferrales bacterium]|nr:transketolase C-terminal domain-containing protein [Candidatus Acidoferrales bacterium]